MLSSPRKPRKGTQGRGIARIGADCIGSAGADRNGLDWTAKARFGAAGMEITMKYKARAFAHIDDKDANKIGRFIEKNFPNGLKPKQLVDAARPKNSPIHKYFEWDDSIAAEKYRQRQASKLIACLVVNIDDTEVRGYHSVRLSTGKRYVSFEDASASEDLWDQVIQSALKEIKIWQSKYSTYQELKPIFKGIEKVERFK